MRLAGIAIAVLLLFAGCGPAITEGDVCRKTWVPAHEIEVDDSMTIDVGDIPVTIPGSHMETIPDRYYITFRKMDESTNKWIEREVQVDLATYDQFKEGDFISFK